MECVEEMPVPPHLQTLFEKATAKWSKPKWRAISWHIPLDFADEDCRELEKLKRRGVIQPLTSPWAAPLVIVWKHCGAL